jgi:hypothetical protein
MAHTISSRPAPTSRSQAMGSRRVAAVDGEGGTGDVAPAPAGEMDHHRGDVLSLAVAP